MGRDPGVQAGLRLRLLGPLRVSMHGRELAPGGPRQRALLALLALSAGSAVPRGQLVDAIWGEDPPPTAANTVQVYMSRLRRLLSASTSAASPLRTVNGAYLLDVDPDAVDVLAFERRYSAGRAALAAGDAASAARTLAEALDLWQGGPLLDLAATTAGEALIARLDALHLAVLADRVEADAALGRHAALVPELQDLVRRHPFDERFAAQLMLALYRDGRQADALATYTQTAARLGDELGVDPGPGLRDVQRRVLAQDADLLVEAARGSDRAPDAIPGGTPGPAVPAALPAPRAAHQPAARASPLGALVGRSQELAAAEALLADAHVRLVTLLGPGGAGKTRLSGELLARTVAGTAAHPLREAAFVPLAAVADPADVLPSICRTLRLEADRPGEPHLDLAARALADRDALLVLDNLEQLAGTGLGDLVLLLDACTRLTVLATSRSLLRLPGEQVVPLGPLPTPDARADLEGVRSSGAVLLFAERAATALPGFEVTAANADAVAELCRRLDGLPLALELAAARVRVLPPEEILHRLDRRLDLLSGGPDALPERQRSMWAAVDWSVRLLTEPERDTLAQLSVFVGGWTLDAAESVCEAGAAEPVVDVVGRLADRSLVVADGSGRMGMLETIRDYAAELLATRPEALRAARGRHAAYYAQLADELGEQAGGGAAAAGRPQRERLDRESGNLRAALEHAADPDAGEPALLGRLVAGQLGYWVSAGRLADAERWTRAARDTDLPDRPRSRLLLSFGNLAALRGDLLRASTLLTEAYACAERLGDDAFMARSLTTLALVARYGGAYAEALDLVEQALEISEALGGQVATHALELERGELLDELGRTREAVPIWQACHEWAVADENLVQLAYASGDLAAAAVDGFDVLDAAEPMDTPGDGDPAPRARAARALAAQAVTAAQDSGSVSVLADLLLTAGLVDLRTGQVAEALNRLRAAVRETHSAGQLLTLPDTVTALALALRASGETHSGARLLAVSGAWRRQHSIAVSGRWLREQAERAAADLPEAERARGERTPFGSLRGLAALDPGLAPRVVDLRALPGQPEAGAEPERVIDLHGDRRLSS